MLRQTFISALAPEISVFCQILVLGNMLGAMSQKEVEYYAHLRNLFWDSVERAFDYWRCLVMPSFADKLEKESLADAEIIGLPSTLPAHAALSTAVKIDSWCAALSKK